MAINEVFDYLLRVAIVGDFDVGKSNLFYQFADNRFVERPVLKGLDCRNKMVDFHGKRIKLSVWDAPGQARCRSSLGMFYRLALGVVLVFDVTNQESFDNLSDWLYDIRKDAMAGAVVILVGNKCDSSDRKVEFETAKKWANKNALQYIETSAKLNLNVEEVFISLVELLKANFEVVFDAKKTCLVM